MRAMSTSKTIHIFKPGTHTAMSGQALSFSEADLLASASAYDPAKHEAPLVIGHPQADAPAYGWVKSLQFAEGGLQAEPDQVDAAFAELVSAGRFKKVSASFYTPASPANPVPGVFYLRHVGFLGAQPPAVKGLKPAEFADDAECVTLEFSEHEPPNEIIEDAAQSDASPQPAITEPHPGDIMSAEDKARLAELEAENARLKQQQADFAEQQKQAKTEAAHASHLAFAEGLIKEGRLLPAQKAVAVQLLDFMAGQEAVVEFGEGDGKQPLIDAVKSDLLAKLPKQIEFGEIAGATPAADAPLAADQYQAKWNADAALRAEFGEFEDYAAFARAESAGLVKIKTGQ